MLRQYNLKSANGGQKGRTKQSIAIIVALMIMCAGFGGITASADTAEDGDSQESAATASVDTAEPTQQKGNAIEAAAIDLPVTMVQGFTKTKYHIFHNTVANLPPAFVKHGDLAQLYSSNDGNWNVVYCLETTNSTMDPDMNEYDTPDPAFTPEQEGLLYHVMSRGPHKFDAYDEEAYKNQYARQLAVWLICENLHNDNPALDVVLFPATGDYKDTEGYAQTLEIGRLARKALDDAKAAYAAGTHKDPVPVPSFLTDDRTSTTAHDMTWDSANKEWQVVLDDKNGTIADAWANAHIKVHDPTSMALDFTISGNSMTIKGLPGYSPRQIEFDNSLPNGKVKYLRNMSDPTHASFQRMARFAQVDGLPLFLTLRATGGPAVPGKPGEPDNPNLAKDIDKPAQSGVKSKVSSHAPKTGDDTDITSFIVIISIATIFIAAIGLRFVIINRRNRPERG